MQLYKVKLINPGQTKPEDNLNGYLAYNYELCLYTRGEALKKAKAFNGKIEKHGKNYTVNETSIVDLSKQELSPAILKELEDREVYVDSDDDINEPIYYADVFSAILGEICETIRPSNKTEIIDELTILDNICAYYDYVRVM